jgi:signal transduction histidine kinase
MTLFGPQAEKKGLRLVLDSSLPVPGPVIADRQGLRQILAKLTSNAVKFTHEGEIVLAAWMETETAGRGLLAIRVTDTGIGIPSELHERIFEPFVQADGSHTRRYGGTGLGLAIACRLAEAMGGTLEVESAPEQGSRFTLRIPVQPAEIRRPPSLESAPR